MIWRPHSLKRCSSPMRIPGEDIEKTCEVISEYGFLDSHGNRTKS